MESHKYTHKDKVSVGGSGLRAWGNLNSVTMPNLLLVPVQREKHGNSGADYEHGKDNFRKYK